LSTSDASPSQLIMPKRMRDEMHVLTELVESAFAADAEPHPNRVRFRHLANDRRDAAVGSVVLFEGRAAARSPFEDDGDLKAMRVREIVGDEKRGVRVIHAASTFLYGCGHDALFETDEVAACTVVSGVLEREIEYVARSMNRFERLGPAAAIPKPRGVLLPPGTWPDELESALKHSRDRAAGRSDWERRMADPARFPYAHRRNPDARVGGEHDGTPCACLGLEIEPGRARRLVRKAGGERGEVQWTEDVVEFTKELGRFEPGVDAWWENGPEPEPKREREPGPRPMLRTLDVFAGCGGLMEGLQQSGLCRDAWAVEICPAACKSYKVNFPNGRVYNEDCNAFLKRARRGDGDVPARGEVEAIVGGPPCQGFSHMNRHRDSEKYQAKNSLAATFLSLCDWYRPKFFMLENVPNFAHLDGGLALQLVVRALLAMKYQFTFEVVQAGNFGAPQSRRRFVLVAVPPDGALPRFPQPTHTFTKWGSNNAVVVGKTRVGFERGASWLYPHVTVREAIGDLNTSNGEYSSAPASAYQRWMREGGGAQPLDHEVRQLSAIQQARVDRVPMASCGADWRDLPDDVVSLGDGRQTARLVRAPETGDASDEKQELTILPWCLAHTASKHANWFGAYGRLQWDGFFPTTLTRVEPAQKQGTALHPSLNRLLTVRECARSQGFPDRFRFEGGRGKAQSQIGNAVPIPLSRALGESYARAFVGSAVA
jgi:site-specific DNA-cytosine methylase